MIRSFWSKASASMPELRCGRAPDWWSVPLSVYRHPAAPVLGTDRQRLQTMADELMVDLERQSSDGENRSQEVVE